MSSENASPDRDAAHQFLIELRTRISTQPLHYQQGVEQAALDSLYKVFGHAREAMKDHPGCDKFAKEATGMLNTILRPFTGKWHRASEAGLLLTRDGGDQFRAELRILQKDLREFANKLGDTFLDGPLNDEILESVWQNSPGGKDEEEWHGLFEDLAAGIPLGTDEPIKEEDAKCLNKGEHDEIQNRRSHTLPSDDSKKASKDNDDPTPLTNAVGLAFSGGGIRSGTFCLGVSQVLAEKGLLKEVDYLSTVSGGGYYGSFLTRLIGNIPTEEGKKSQANTEEDNSPAGVWSDIAVPDGPDSSDIRYVRQRAQFLSPRGAMDFLGMITDTVIGTVMNWLVPVAVIIFFAIVVSFFNGLPSEFKGLLTCLSFFPLLGTIATTLIYQIRLRLSKQDAKWWKHATSLFLGLLLLQGAHYVLTWCFKILFPCFVDQAPGSWKNFTSNIQGWDLLSPITNLGLSAGALAAAAPVIASLFPVLRSPKALSIMTRIGMLIAALLVPIAGILLALTLGAFARVCEIPFAVDHTWISSILPYWPDGTWILGLVLIVLTVITAFFLNINHTAIHRVYRNRLSKTFVETDDKKDLDTELTKINPGGLAPYHLINAAVNLPSSNNDRLRDRKADFFLFSKCFTGSPVTGFHETGDWEMNGKKPDLATAMAISGGAFSSHMGLNSLPLVRALLTVLNVRLGFWIRRANSGAFGRFPVGKNPGFFCLLREMSGVAMSEKEHWVNLSDGGHIENLATYELLRRRCKFIICVDGEADPEFTFVGLMTMVRHAQIDFGIRIEPDVDDFRLNPDTDLSRSHYHFCRIHYPDGQKGLLLYIKLSVTGNESELIKRYRHNHPAFPHQTTLDQFFDEEQFEAYRQLGVHAASGLFACCLTEGKKTGTMREWFKVLAKNLLEPSSPKASDK